MLKCHAGKYRDLFDPCRHPCYLDQTSSHTGISRHCTHSSPEQMDGDLAELRQPK